MLWELGLLRPQGLPQPFRSCACSPHAGAFTLATLSGKPLLGSTHRLPTSLETPEPCTDVCNSSDDTFLLHWSGGWSPASSCGDRVCVLFVFVSPVPVTTDGPWFVLCISEEND